MSTALSIQQSLATAIRAMTVAGGYTYNVQATSVMLDPVNLETLSPAMLPAFYVHIDSPGERGFLSPMRVKDRLNFTVVARADATGLAFDRKHTTFAALVADLEKALTVDITRGGLATDTKLGQPEAPLMQLGNGNIVVVVQPVSVLTYRVYGQP